MVSEELEVLKIVAHRLDNSGIKYMLSGSMAANFYAQPRMTRDIDIVVQLSAFEVDKIHYLFKDDFYIDKESITEALKNNSAFNIIHNEKVIKIDFIISEETDYERIKFQRRIKKDIEDLGIFVISPEDLILSKLLWAKDSYSQMQLKDVKNIVSFNKDTLDSNYLKHWAEKLSVNNLLKECQNAA